jgi:hypothetical protein
VTSLAGLLSIVEEYAGSRMVCYGLNPRPAILSKANGALRSAKEGDLALSQSLLLDIDLEGEATTERLASLKRELLPRADQYVASLGCRRPGRCSSGNRGSHLRFAYAPISVVEVPDIGERLRYFREGFVRAVRQDLSRLEARVDTGTLNLRAMIKVWGTSKPGGSLSRFYGGARVEDPALREYLLRLEVAPSVAVPAVCALVVGGELPSWFSDLLGTDERVRSLWHGEGKHRGDTTASGYDFSLLQALVRRGHADPAELGTIISLRPGASTKGQDYVSRTVATALQRVKGT